MKKKKAENWLCISGVISNLFYFLHLYWGQKKYLGYNWLNQAVSDLTAIDAVSYVTATKFSSLYGMSACVCCLIISLMVRGRYNKTFRNGIYLFTIMNLLSYLGYTLFPLSGKGYMDNFQDIMHLYVVTLGVVLLSITSLVFLIIGGLKNNGNKIIGILGILTFTSMLFGSVAMNIYSKEYFGLFERFSIFGVVIFTGSLGVFGFLIPIKDKR
jgi:hypothetical protein